MQYSLLAVDFMSHDAMHDALMGISASIAYGHMRPLQTVNHGIKMVANALRQMSQARHVGKVVVAPGPPIKNEGLDGSFLVTGGTGEIARLPF